MPREGKTQRRAPVDPAEPTVSEVLQPGAMLPPLMVIDPDNPRTYEELVGMPDAEDMAAPRLQPSEDILGARKHPTHKQQQFIVECLKGLSASEAYRRAYDCEGSKPQTVWNEASKLMLNPLVASRLAAGWRRAEEAALVGAPSLRRLTQSVLINEAQVGDTSSARIAAAVKIGQLAGVRAFEEGSEEDGAVSADDITKELRDRLAAIGVSEQDNSDTPAGVSNLSDEEPPTQDPQPPTVSETP